MLAKITLLSAVGFAAIYPLSFLLSMQDPLKNKFHRFHLALPNIVAGISAVYVLTSNFNLLSQVSIGLWFVVMTGVFRYYWHKEFPNALVVCVPCIVGINTMIILQDELLGGGIFTCYIGVLSGAIFCASLYAMNLGHWYLNVHGLPIKHLKNAVYVLWLLLVLRGVWDGYLIATQSVAYQGEMILLRLFLFKLEGFFLFIGITFGTLLPAASLFFVNEILKIRNTQAATGILYVILCSVVIGDLTYKYYLIKYGIPL